MDNTSAVAVEPFDRPDAVELPQQPPAAAPSPSGTVRLLSEEERLLLDQNQRIKSLNRAPDDFPAFIRKGECAHTSPDLR